MKESTNAITWNIDSMTRMTSREISELTGKRHSHVVRDLKSIAKKLSINTKDIEHRYLDSMNRCQSEYVLDGEILSFIKYSYLGSSITYGLQERAALNAIEQVLSITLIRQYKVGKYRIDGYDPENNTAYEVDEHQHNTPKHKKADLKRQAFIESVLGCNFIRVNV